MQENHESGNHGDQALEENFINLKKHKEKAKTAKFYFLHFSLYDIQG